MTQPRNAGQLATQLGLPLRGDPPTAPSNLRPSWKMQPQASWHS